MDPSYTTWHRSPSRHHPTWDNSQKPQSPRHGKGRGRGKAPSPRPKQNKNRRGKKPQQGAEQPQQQASKQTATPALPDPGQGSQSWMALLQMQQAANQAAQSTTEPAASTSSSTAAPPQSAAMKNLLTSLKKIKTSCPRRIRTWSRVFR